MIPIYEQGQGTGIGHSFDTLVRRFIDICNAHLESGRAKGFAMLFYDFEDKALKNILKNQGGFAKLDRLSGTDLSFFTSIPQINACSALLMTSFSELLK